MTHPNIPTIEQLVADPSFPSWGKQTINEAIGRDPVDAANTLEILYRVFAERVDTGKDNYECSHARRVFTHTDGKTFCVSCGGQL